MNKRLFDTKKHQNMYFKNEKKEKEKSENCRIRTYFVAFLAYFTQVSVKQKVIGNIFQKSVFRDHHTFLNTLCEF